MNFLDFLLTDFSHDISINRNTVFLNKIAVAILLPCITFAIEDLKYEKFLIINTTNGIFKVNLKNTIGIWEMLIKNNCLIFGDQESVLEVQNLFDSSIYSRNLVYLSLFAKNCGELLEFNNLISNVSIAVIGCGGLGSLSTMALAGSGIKNFTLIDYDKVEFSNLNRQLFYSLKDIGKFKIDILFRELKEKFSDIHVMNHYIKVNNSNFDLFLSSDVILVSADSPLGLSRLLLNHFKGKKDIIVAGYANNFSSVSFYFKNNKKQIIRQINDHNDNYRDLFWHKIEHSIMPSFTPVNMELASIISSVLILQICKISHTSKAIFNWENNIFPRLYVSYE